MTIARGELLAILHECSVGLSSKEVLVQSNAFVFSGKYLLTFNDDVMARHANPLGFDAAVNAADLMAILSKIPDEEIEVAREGGEIIIKGKRRSAGIACASEIGLPIDAVPPPSSWSKIKEGVMPLLQQAAKCCGKDESQYLATCVHITPKLIEASDNFRLYRVTTPTGFPEEVLVPGAAINVLSGMEVTEVSQGKGWVHFRTTSKTEISLRCSHQKYHETIGDILKMVHAEIVTLPRNLSEIVERAEVMLNSDFNATVGIRIEDEMLTLTTRKEGGWYKEKKRIGYSGRSLDFDINPQFLVELLQKTHEVAVGDGKLKISLPPMEFVVALAQKADSAPSKAKDDDVDERAAAEEAVLGDDRDQT